MSTGLDAVEHSNRSANAVIHCVLDPADPAKYSNWTEYKPGGRPRSAIVVIL